MKNKMRTKNLLVTFLTFATVLFLAATVGAADITNEDNVIIKVDGTFVCEKTHVEDVIVDNVTVEVDVCDTISVIAGETISVSVRFTSLVFDEDVTVEVELDGEGDDVEERTSKFDVEPDQRYRKTASIRVPYDLDDDLSDELELNIEIDGRDHKTNIGPIMLKVQRPSFNAAIKSITTSQSVNAGDDLDVDFVLKNIGYNDLDDLYVTASIEALGIQTSGYFGDIVALECDDDDTGFPWSPETLDRNCNEDDEDSVSGTVTLEIPNDAQAGIYTIELSVRGDDVSSTRSAQVIVENDFESIVFKSGMTLWLVNPTDNVVGYRIVAESPGSVSESIVFVPAGASQSIAVSANVEGEYSFDVNVFSISGNLVDSVTFSGSTGAVLGDGDNDGTNPVVILTVILAIIFIVLLIVLIVLIGKKPEKSGEFGESYY